MASTAGEEAFLQEPGTVRESSHSKRFRFKRKQERVNTDESDSRHHHKHHHRSKRHKSLPRVNDDPSAYDDSTSNLPPDAAFRESLFDAMGDDEGAAFWEGVYGQPIHNYPKTHTNQATGELERMSDDEYAQYVRRKMWEKSWEGIEIEREEQRRKRQAEKNKIREEGQSGSLPKEAKNPSFVFDIEFEKSLERGERRRDKKRWKTLWEDYLRRWDDLQAMRETHKVSAGDTEQPFLRNKIAWPVESGKRKDVNLAEIENFVGKCAHSFDADLELITTLKTERVRWHPDKIQQRYGFMQIDENTMQGVTATFQAFDQMWNDLRLKKS